MSSTNPFRSQDVSPTPTGSSSMAGPSSSSSAPPMSFTEPESNKDPVGLEEDMPPAYTPAADVYQGESSIEVGPRRPFQQPPRHPTNNAYANPQGNGWSEPQPSQQQWVPPPTVTPAATGSNSWSSYPGQSVNSRNQYYSSSTPPWGSSRSVGRPPGGLIGTLFETVRDVVDLVSGTPETHSQAAQHAARSAYAPPHSQPSSSSPYSHQRGLSSGSAGTSQQPQPTNNVPDDGSPTRTPVPGHPLLKDGMLLVYPNQYLCVKCRNTGYKNNDPSHPCRKCWEKYGKPYTGALTYTPWSNDPSSRNSRLQRALPAFTPPHLSAPASFSLSPQPTGPSPYAPSQSYGSSPYPNTMVGPGPHYYVRNPSVGVGIQPPVPGAIAVRPGDPCLGGRICWRCGGTGTLPLFIIDVKACTTCGGMGRK
ncbi:hypothetical protein BV22DRAFT_1003003 [Leucogyrophana mollusca]|uniref:Uncharacterized protein n=1 Tax=Leucogyrophana mollusca TaxID=85980 RepID=A0ACB8BWV2_9AGAM|nr:hypothetical protein BV22DRAFT_1003003 [Leucogyrophana mollusca]